MVPCHANPAPEKAQKKRRCLDGMMYFDAGVEDARDES